MHARRRLRGATRRGESGWIIPFALLFGWHAQAENQPVEQLGARSPSVRSPRSGLEDSLVTEALEFFGWQEDHRPDGNYGSFVYELPQYSRFTLPEVNGGGEPYEQ